MNIKITTKNGLDLQYYDHRNIIYVEKTDEILMLQWYDEYNDVSDSRAIFNVATLELSND